MMLAMVIDRSGTWWRSEDAADLDDYLIAFTANGYPVGPIRHSSCERCGGHIFGVRGDDDVARRTCRACDSKAFIADSEENWADATIRTCRCPCGSIDFNVAVGFSLRDGGEVRWVTVAQRCVSCGVLGSFADWKISYAPTGHLVAMA